MTTTTNSWGLVYRMPDNMINHLFEGLPMGKALEIADRFISEGFSIEMLYDKKIGLYTVRVEKLIEEEKNDEWCRYTD